VARRWRIRHKLMLALATAVAILATLLAGTVKGLWSYHLTTKSIESKLQELDKAENLKTAVEQLLLPGGIEASGPDVCEDKIRKLEGPIAEVHTALERFKIQFNSTVDRHLTPLGDGAHILGQVEALNGKLESFRQLIRPPDGGPSATNSSELSELRLEPLRTQARKLMGDAGDLRQAVRDELAFLLNRSRRNYQVSVCILIIPTVLGLVLMLSALRFFYAWIFNPVRDLQEGVRHVARGDFDQRIEVHSGDEMEELASAFNDMACRLRDLYRDMAHQINERSRQLVRSERLASVGFLAAGVAHEINNPLASIAFCSEALEARLGEILDALDRSGRGAKELDVFAKYLKMIQEEAFRCKNITERLLEFSRPGERKRERTDLAHLIQSVLDVTQHLQNSKGKEILFQATPSPLPPLPPGERGRGEGAVFAWINAEEIKSVVLNLVVNALDSMDEGGRLAIVLGSRDGMAEIGFRDTGCGMTAEVLENIFEPFFTRNRSGKGTGLGLTITHRIISQHGGEIEAASPGPGQGSTFRVRLPIEAAVASPGLKAGAIGAGKEESLGNAAA
jgi:two-component system, NtrC family, sensor kinase